MSDKKINKSELELLQSAVDRIVNSEVLESEISSFLPKVEDLSDSNKIYHCKTSVLFVDMRKSTKLPEQFDNTQLAKIYRSYIRVIVQAIRYSGGFVKDFMGDGVLAMFIDGEDGRSEDKAVNAAKYITTCIDKILNPVLDSTLDYRISCGIGIHTGEISVSKVGMKGKSSEEAESEYGIAWIGSSTNLACKFSGAVENGDIFISSSTYKNISSIEDKENWNHIKIENNGNLLEGFISKNNYLSIDVEYEIESFPAGMNKHSISLMDNISSILNKKVNEIEQKSIELGRREEKLKSNESTLASKIAKFDDKEKEHISKEIELNFNSYKFYCDILGSAHCKALYTIEMGVDFWEKNLNNAILAGRKIGKSRSEVKQKVSYAMVSIYADLQMYDKAYDFLVEQAEGYAWLNMSTVKKIVKAVGYCDRLKSALYYRLNKNDLSDTKFKEFEEIKDWLDLEYRR